MPLVEANQMQEEELARGWTLLRDMSVPASHFLQVLDFLRSSVRGSLYRSRLLERRDTQCPLGDTSPGLPVQTKA